MDKILLETTPKDGVKLYAKTLLDPILQANNEDRKIIDVATAKRMAHHNKMLKVGSIPVRVLMAMPHEKRELLMSDNKCLRKWLEAHPEYKTTTARIK